MSSFTKIVLISCVHTLTDKSGEVGQRNTSRTHNSKSQCIISGKGNGMKNGVNYIYIVLSFYWWALLKYLVKFTVSGTSMLVDNGSMNWFRGTIEWILVTKLSNIDKTTLIHIQQWFCSFEYIPQIIKRELISSLLLYETKFNDIYQIHLDGLFNYFHISWK